MKYIKRKLKLEKISFKNSPYKNKFKSLLSKKKLILKMKKMCKFKR